MPTLNKYNNLEDLIKAITHKQVDIENLLDWESERKLSKWLEEKGEVDKARRLTEEYDIQIETPSLILEILSFSEEEIKNIIARKNIDNDSHQSKALSLEELNRKVNLLEKQIHVLNDIRMPIGTISLFPTENIPCGWLPCKGQCLSKSYFESLFARIGYTWGNSGKYYFCLPNLQQLVCSTGLYYCIFTGKNKDLPAEAVKSFSLFTINDVSFEMIFVEGGSFMMGATKEQEDMDIYSSARPTHQVTLSSYWIGKFQVTQALWKTIMLTNPSKFKGDTLPVENVNFYECIDFICKLNELTGEHFRLPTEAEWEYAARGGRYSQGFKYSGSNILTNVAWYIENSNYRTHPVGQKRPNELGIYDMSGNVLEWCADWYECYSSAPQTNPFGPTNGDYQIVRGGGGGK